jgi:DNA-binding transcriptional MerR regulator
LPSGANVSEPSGLTVQQAAQLTGLSEYNLRFYERAGLIGPVSRDPANGYRRYSPQNLVQCETLACLRSVGMSLDEMRHYFEAATRGRDAAPEQIALLEAQGVVLDARIEALGRAQGYLRLKADYWRAIQAGDDERAAAIAQEFSQRLRDEAARES